MTSKNNRVIVRSEPIQRKEYNYTKGNVNLKFTLRNDIKQEIAKAREALKDEIVNLTISGVENVVGEKLTEESDRKLVRDFLDNLGKKQ